MRKCLGPSYPHFFPPPTYQTWLCHPSPSLVLVLLLSKLFSALIKIINLARKYEIFFLLGSFSNMVEMLETLEPTKQSAECQNPPKLYVQKQGKKMGAKEQGSVQEALIFALQVT